MSLSLHRRAFLTSAALAALAVCPVRAARTDAAWQARLATVENGLDGRLGVFALDTGDKAQLAFRADERFPLCSTFKLLAAAALLAQPPATLERIVRYGADSLLAYSPVTKNHVDDGMSVAELCAAALRYSDNTAGNALLSLLGGPSAVTAFAHSIGDTVFRLDRWETALNSAIPGDVRDTTSPRAMAGSLRRLLFGEVLSPPARERLREDLLGSTTGAAKIRAGVPATWRVADKTGGGGYGTANDVGVLWPPGRAPLVLAIYTTRRDEGAAARDDAIAAATRIVVAWHAART